MTNVKHNKFPGFPQTIEKSFWQFPSIINGYVHSLSGAEFKVLWYILRHTFGWQKSADKLSITQICNGIIKRDGTIIDRGVGLSRKWAWSALKSLEEKGFITIKRESGKVNSIIPRTINYSSKYHSTVVENTPVTIVESTPTINNSTINNTNSSDTKGRCPLGTNGEHKENCIDLIDRVAEEKKIRTFPNYGKQINAIHKGLRAGFTIEDIEDMAAKLIESPFWQDRGWDLMSVINELGKGSKDVS